MPQRRQRAAKRLTPSEWHKQQEKKRIKRFAPLSDNALEKRLADVRDQEALLRTEIQIAENKHAALQPALRVMMEHMHILVAEKGLISKRNQKTGWSGFFSPGITVTGEKELRLCDQAINACSEQMRARGGHCGADSRLNSLWTKFKSQAVDISRQLERVEAEIELCRKELAQG